MLLFAARTVVSGKDNSQREGQWSAGLSSAGAASSSIFVATKFCRDELTFVATNMRLLSPQNACRNKRFVVTKVFCRDKRNSVETKVFANILLS